MSHLINTISELQEFVRVANGLDYKSLLPAINEVESGEMEYYLGTELLEQLIQSRSSGVFGANEEKLSKHAAMAVGCLAVYKAGPEIEVSISENGIFRQESNNEKSAFGGQVKRLRDTVGARGYKALDKMIAWLEKNEADFSLWLDSEYYQDRSTLLIRSVSEFEAAGENIKSSALTFQSLKPIMKEIQESRIAMILPEGMYQDVFDNQNEPDNIFLLRNYIRPAIAKLTIEEALSALPVELDHEGVHINQIATQGDARTLTSAPIHLIEKKTWSLRGRGEHYLSNMKEYLNTQASTTKYPLWFGSDRYRKTLKAQIEEESIHPSERKIYRA